MNSICRIGLIFTVTTSLLHTATIATAAQPSEATNPIPSIAANSVFDHGPNLVVAAKGIRKKPQVVATCTTAKRRPHRLSWCDDSDTAIRLHWSKWGYREARGRGVMLNNTCMPSCAEGSYERFRVTVRLHRVRRAGKHMRLTRATFHNRGQGRGVYLMPLRPL